MITLKSLKSARAELPPRVMIYGPPGVGKTTLASEFPAPVFLQVEDGTPGDLELTTFGHLQSYEAIMEAVSALYGEDHDFQTVVLDSADKLEPLLWAEVCARNGWKSIEDPGYGKGYVEADGVWREFLEGMNALRRDKNMAIVLIGHSAITQFPNPAGAEYPRWDIRLHKRALGIMQDEMDAILLINQEASVKEEKGGFNKVRTHATGGSARWIYAEQRPAWVAKNRYGMEAKFAYRKGEGYAAMAKYFPGQSNIARAKAA